MGGILEKDAPGSQFFPYGIGPFEVPFGPGPFPFSQKCLHLFLESLVALFGHFNETQYAVDVIEEGKGFFPEGGREVFTARRGLVDGPDGFEKDSDGAGGVEILSLIHI